MLEQTYRRYLAALNERRFTDLDEFVHDRLVYNGAELTREQYATMLAANARAVPDLRYDVDLLVVDGDHVACRLWFDCRPQGEFLGVPVGGRRVSFAEHVFYRMPAGRIERVWSMLDTDAVRQQAAG